MGLTSKEKKLLESLQEKAEQEDPPTTGRSVSYHVDLSDNAAVAMAKKLGLLSDDDDDDDEEEEVEEAPKRKGGGSKFFGEQ